jgi:uncharacterized protein
MGNKFGQAEMLLNVLKKSGDWMSSADAAELIVKSYPAYAKEKMHASENHKIQKGEMSVAQQISAELGARKNGFQKKYPEIELNDDGVKRMWRVKTVAKEEPQLSRNQVGACETVVSENALYAPLSKTLHKKFGVVCHRIDEKETSRGDLSNKWLHPDLVGMKDLYANTLHEGKNANIKTACLAINPSKLSLWAFEVKTELTVKNVRECYAQAVMNSSWANYGYLVCTNTRLDDRILEEVRGLSQRFGIGLMRFNFEGTIDSDGIVIDVPAFKRDEVDTFFMNRLAENTSFNEFLKGVALWSQTSQFTGVLEQRD